MMTVCAPSAASAFAMPRPIPTLAPVTTATLPPSSRSMLSSRSQRDRSVTLAARNDAYALLVSGVAEIEARAVAEHLGLDVPRREHHGCGAVGHGLLTALVLRPNVDVDQPVPILL